MIKYQTILLSYLNYKMSFCKIKLKQELILQTKQYRLQQRTYSINLRKYIPCLSYGTISHLFLPSLL